MNGLRVLLLTLFCVVFGASHAVAEDGKTESSPAPKSCSIRVRAIKGEKLNTDGIKRSVKSGPMLQDLTKHLETLPYDHYRVLDVNEQQVVFGEKGEFKLRGERDEVYSLRVHPQTVVNKRIQLLVEWKGPNGESLLSSKLRVENGKNVVVGTDSEDDASTMFCIFVNCA